MEIYGVLFTGLLLLGCQERGAYQGLGAAPIFIDGSLETYPGHGYAKEGDMTLALNADGRWYAGQSDYYNEAGCSWGQNSGAANGTWRAENGERILRLDSLIPEGQLGPLVALDGAILKWTIRGWSIVDINGKEINFWRVAEYQRSRSGH